MSLEFIIEKECPFKKKYESDLMFILDLMKKTHLTVHFPHVLPVEPGTAIRREPESESRSLQEIEAYLRENRFRLFSAPAPFFR